MDILDVIKKEHQEVAALIDQVEKYEPGDKQLTDLARKMAKALTTHVKIEEKLFYSRLRDRAEDDEELVDMYEAYTEHDVASHLIALLKAKRTPDAEFKAELQVLGESVKHHVKEEESTVFGMARKLMDKSERDELGSKWVETKERSASRGTAPRKAAPAKKPTR